MSEVEVVLGRHDERIKDIENRQTKMENALSKIYFALVGIGGGVIVSLILLIVNLTVGS